VSEGVGCVFPQNTHGFSLQAGGWTTRRVIGYLLLDTAATTAGLLGVETGTQCGATTAVESVASGSAANKGLWTSRSSPRGRDVYMHVTMAKLNGRNARLGQFVNRAGSNCRKLASARDVSCYGRGATRQLRAAAASRRTETGAHNRKLSIAAYTSLSLLPPALRLP
jgi:hypothetical protein